MRGRPRAKGPNPLTRSYESNGPDVKVRGTAQHIADKYAQLSRDAHASGDPVASENYLQHAEHYYRLIAAAQEAYRQQYGAPRDEEGGEEGDEEAGFGGSQSGQGDEFGDVPAYPQGGQGFEQRGDRQQRFDRNDRQQNQNRPQQRFDRNSERYDRNNGQDRGPSGDRNQDRGDRYDRQGGQNGYDRQGGGEPRADRQNGGDRYDRSNSYEQRQERPDQRQERPDQRQERSDQRPERQERPDQRPDRQDRTDRPERRERYARDDRPREDRPNREGFGPRDARPERDTRRDARPAAYGAEAAVEDAPTGANLPAFLTNPVRPAVSVDEVAESTGLAPAPLADAEAPEATGIRPRKRRTRKVDPTPEGVDETADGA